MLKQRQTVIRFYTSTVLGVFTFLLTTVSSANVCQVQKIYRGFKTPYQIQRLTLPPDANQETLKQMEESLLGQIGSQPGHELFPIAYASEHSAQKLPLSLKTRVSWLDCVRQYIQFDTDKDGIGDWLALVDGRPSRVLVPFDQDFDGDGISNIFDTEPFTASTQSRRDTAAINTQPADIARHLWLERDAEHEKNKLQKELYSRFQILAINQTDSHSSTVLRAFIEFFESLPKKFIHSVKHLKYIYAYASHLRLSNVSASYFPTTRSISIGGETYYKSELPDADKTLLLRRIAHEFGHAILFSRLTPRELAQIANVYGSWPAMELAPESFYSPAFFKTFGHSIETSGFPSNYAHENIHEWFAESFSTYWMYKRSGSKVPSMQIQPSEDSHADVLTAGLNQWFEELIYRPQDGNSAP